MKKTLQALSSPHKIQEYLDELPYSLDEMTRSAGAAISMNKAHCFDGALIAAAALEYHGQEPLLMDLLANGNDDDHVLAVFRYKGHFGAIAKSNYVGIRFREPVYRTLRELAISYFNNYVTIYRERTLREYSSLVKLTPLKSIDWRNAPSDVDVYEPLAAALDRARHYRLFPKSIERALQPSDKRLVAGETVGLDKRGIFHD